tara:strand:- start:3298 stop:3510 length:213 start_codon:yes stop_codon:yes gene_type:complete
MFRLKEETLMTNEEKIELVHLTELIFGANGHALLDMRRGSHKRLAELQRKAQNELDETESSLLEQHLIMA